MGIWPSALEKVLARRSSLGQGVGKSGLVYSQSPGGICSENSVIGMMQVFHAALCFWSVACSVWVYKHSYQLSKNCIYSRIAIRLITICDGEGKILSAGWGGGREGVGEQTSGPIHP